MIIEKTITDNSRDDIYLDDFAAEGELTVTITLNEYRKLVQSATESKCKREHESWLEQYQRANNAEERVKELEVEVNTLYKRLSEPSAKEDEGGEG